MKFTNGYWVVREGVRAFHPQEAYEIEARPASLTVTAPTRRIAERGDTLGGVVLTIELSSPLEEVIRVRISHFTGELSRRPAFDIGQPSGCGAVTEDAESASLSSGRFSARVTRKGGWRLGFSGDGREVTSSGAKAMGYIEQNDGGRYVHEQLDLGVGELVYGLGERFTAFAKNGQVIEMWNADGGTASEQAYKNVPFYLTNRGYGVFVNHPGAVSFEVASEKVSRVQFSVPGETLEYFIIYGPTPKEVLAKYTALTGRPSLPPAWSFGLWLTTSFTTSYDEATVTSFIQGMADRDLPLHVFHFDSFWMREYNWCDLTWDRRTFPDPEGMLRRLKERGLRICLWINPYIAQRSPLFAEGAEAGYLLKRPSGDVWQTDLWQPGMGIVDFTSEGARRWYAERLSALLDMGVDTFKTDFGERIPTDVVYHDGSDPERMHNYYTLLYNRTVFELLEARRGKGEAVVFARSATAGAQKYPVHWGGDCESTFESMAESLRGGLSLGLSGFGFWSHDIGGFEGTPPVEVYKRWIAFGLLSSHSRLHGSNSYRVPWLFDEEAVEVLRLFTKLKCRLMPYLYRCAAEAAQSGVPLMRAMLLEFPDDPTAAHLDRQYMLGDRLLVAPVFSPEGWVEYYLPEGSWTSLLTGEVKEGGRWFREKHSAMSLPLYVRPSSIIAIGARDDRPDYDYTAGTTLRVYRLADRESAFAEIPSLTGERAARVEVEREGNRIRVWRRGELAAWRLELVGISGGSARAGCTVEATPAGLLALPVEGTESLEVHIAP